MTDRISLALAACEGLPNEELVKRGKSGFAKMIVRKRNYAAMARKLAPAYCALQEELAKTKAELVKAQQTIAMLQQLDMPVTDVTDASNLLAGIMKKGD